MKKSFQLVEPTLPKQYVVITDSDNYEHYFSVSNGCLFLSNQDIGKFETLDQDEIESCKLSKDASISLAKYLYEHIVGKKKCN